MSDPFRKQGDLWQVSARNFQASHSNLPSRRWRPSRSGGVDTIQERSPLARTILFHEYFHGDNGAGIGASHQTGWTGLVAKLLEQSGE